MGRPRAEVGYENQRNARILENQARLASLGLQKTISDLRATALSAKSKTPVRKWTKRTYSLTSLRRSGRLKQSTAVTVSPKKCLRRSTRLNGKSLDPLITKQGYGISKLISDDGGIGKILFGCGGDEKRPANAPLVKIIGWKPQLDSNGSSRRCDSKGRGSVYDPVFGICCHFCRQKKLCGEEDCKRCGSLDPDQACIGKTDCSVCHSSNGVLCRACLKVRYGEEMEEVQANKEWVCPHCIEEKGIKPYWICNSSFCLKKRKMVPTGIAIFRAREMGYTSVAHLVMDELQKADKKRN